ncbi:MAG: OB-fold nucleic acid binding domain-containing protein, partial [Aquimonas sp.]
MNKQGTPPAQQVTGAGLQDTSRLGEAPEVADAQENFLIAERRSKLKALREAGPAFPNDFRREHYAGDLQAEYADAERFSADALAEAGRTVQLGGRLLAKRVMGKASFAQIQDESGRIQLYLTRDGIGEENYAAFKAMDIGDIVGVSGGLTRTRTGEL